MWKFEGKKRAEKVSIILNEDSYVPPHVYSSLIEIQVDKNNCFLFNTNETCFVLPLLWCRLAQMLDSKNLPSAFF